MIPNQDNNLNNVDVKSLNSILLVLNGIMKQPSKTGELLKADSDVDSLSCTRLNDNIC